jgi:hypothetical protein
MTEPYREEPLMTQKLKTVLEEFLAQREWRDELRHDAEAETTTLNTGIELSNQTGRLEVEVCEKTQFVTVHVIYSIKCKDSAYGELCKLLNEIHRRGNYGRFQCLGNRIGWTHRVDFEGAVASAVSIERMVSPGWNLADQWADAIVDVAVLGRSADEALAALEARDKPVH